MNTADQQTDANRGSSTADPKGAKLRQTLEHLTLQKMIDRVEEEDLNIKELCHLLHTCCGHKKAAVAEEKIRSTERIAIQRLNKTSQPTTNSNPTNPAHNRLPLRDPDSPQTQPPLIGDPNIKQSHQDFCKNLTQAAMDIWGLDISKMCKTDKPYDDENDPSGTGTLYDIPPQYRQGATPIQGSQDKYGQPKYTHKQWRRIMFRAIRANYGIHDDPKPPPQNHDHSSPRQSPQPRPKPLASSRPQPQHNTPTTNHPAPHLPPPPNQPQNHQPRSPRQHLAPS